MAGCTKDANAYFAAAVFGVTESRQIEFASLLPNKDVCPFNLTQSSILLPKYARPIPLKTERLTLDVVQVCYKTLYEIQLALRLFESRGFKTLPLTVFNIDHCKSDEQSLNLPWTWKLLKLSRRTGGCDDINMLYKRLLNTDDDLKHQCLLLPPYVISKYATHLAFLETSPMIVRGKTISTLETFLNSECTSFEEATTDDYSLLLTMNMLVEAIRDRERILMSTRSGKNNVEQCPNTVTSKQTVNYDTTPPQRRQSSSPRSPLKSTCSLVPYHQQYILAISNRNGRPLKQTRFKKFSEDCSTTSFRLFDEIGTLTNSNSTFQLTRSQRQRGHSAFDLSFPSSDLTFPCFEDTFGNTYSTTKAHPFSEHFTTTVRAFNRKSTDISSLLDFGTGTTLSEGFLTLGDSFDTLGSPSWSSSYLSKERKQASFTNLPYTLHGNNDGFSDTNDESNNDPVALQHYFSNSSEFLHCVGRKPSLIPKGGGFYDKAATFARIKDLILEYPTHEIPLFQLPGLYLARHHTPLDPMAFNYPTLKSLLLACADLSLVWIYEPPPSIELCQMRQALKLNANKNGNKNIFTTNTNLSKNILDGNPELETKYTLPAAANIDNNNFAGNNNNDHHDSNNYACGGNHKNDDQNNDPFMSLSAAIRILRQKILSSDETEDNNSLYMHNNIAQKDVFVVEREPTVKAISRDVIVALVAHWVTIHESSNSHHNDYDLYSHKKMMNCPLQHEQSKHDNNTKSRTRASPKNSLRKSGSTIYDHPRSLYPSQLSNSSIGMPLSLLARTWDTNCANICTLYSVLERSGVADLETFVRSIPAFIVVNTCIKQDQYNKDNKNQYSNRDDDDDNEIYGVESPIMIYLKHSARIPIVPELVPDPTTIAFSAPIDQHQSGTASLVFFPPAIISPNSQSKSIASVNCESNNENKNCNDSLLSSVVKQKNENCITPFQPQQHEHDQDERKHQKEKKERKGGNDQKYLQHCLEQHKGKQQINCTNPTLLIETTDTTNHHHHHRSSNTVYFVKKGKPLLVHSHLVNTTSLKNEEGSLQETCQQTLPVSSHLRQEEEEGGLLKEDLHAMLFELITINCEWQALRWTEGEDFVEIHEEEMQQQTSIAKSTSFVTSTNNKDDYENNNTSRILITTTTTTPVSKDEQQWMRIKKKEFREGKRKRKILLREWCRKEHNNVSNINISADNLKDNNTIENQNNNVTTSTPMVSSSMSPLDLTVSATTTTTTSHHSNTTFAPNPFVVIDHFNDDDKVSLEQQELIQHLAERLKHAVEDNDPVINQQRQEYRNRSVGIYVSSIKMEWSKYFDTCYPLIYFMERFRFKKIKQLLEEVPNLIITGDGGFMRVVTTHHAKLLCSLYPPSGTSLDGKTILEPTLTDESNDVKFQCQTYLSSVLSEEQKKFNAKSQFVRKLSAANIHHLPSSARLKLFDHINSKMSPIIYNEHNNKGVNDKNDDIPESTRFLNHKNDDTSNVVLNNDNNNNNNGYKPLAKIWEMPTLKARALMKIMLVDLVRIHCARQHDEKMNENNNNGIEKSNNNNNHWIIEELLAKKLNGLTNEHHHCTTPLLEEEECITSCLNNGITGLKLNDLPSRWNCSFVPFAPMTSFLKKAGFQNGSKDLEFIEFIENELKRELLIIGYDGTYILFPANIQFLNDTQYHRPQQMSSSAWMKRKSQFYSNLENPAAYIFGKISS